MAIYTYIYIIYIYIYIQSLRCTRFHLFFFRALSDLSHATCWQICQPCCIRDLGWKTSASKSCFRTWDLHSVGMTLTDLFRLLQAKPWAVLLSIHHTQWCEICGLGAIQPPADLCCQRWLGLIGSAAQARRFLPISAPWRSLPHLPPKCAPAPVDLSALIYGQCIYIYIYIYVCIDA